MIMNSLAFLEKFNGWNHRSSWETAATFDPLVSPGEQGSAIMDASSQASLMGGASQDDGGTGSPPAKGASQAKKAKKTKLKNVFNPKR